MAPVLPVPSSTALHAVDIHRRRAPIATPPIAPSSHPLRVVVCHPASLAGQAIAATLRTSDTVAEVAVVGSATDLVRVTPPHRWDVALVSETLGADLAELLQALAFRGVVLPVVIMTTDADPDVAAQNLEWGAAGSVDVRRPVSVLQEAIRVGASGEPVIDERIGVEIVGRLGERAARRDDARLLLGSLSSRERQVLESLSRGTGVAEIARALHLSPHTIRACISTLGPKLDVTGQLRIAAVARELLVSAQQPSHFRYLHQVRLGRLVPLQLTS